MKKVIIYIFVSEVKTVTVDDKTEYDRIMNIFYNDEKKYKLIGEINLENNNCHQTMIITFNKILKDYYKTPFIVTCCCFTNADDESIEAKIELRDTMFVYAHTLTLENIFYEMMESFFKDCGFEITDYNNNKNVFWFKSI
jgi:hypothetical protein